MKIVRLTASNVKRLKAVEIEPNGTVQVITGRNAQGKSSVLDAIWLALGGGAASRETTRPIRDGEDRASVTLDMGDLVVTRTWKGSKTELTVASADGAKFSGPQGILDALVGRLSFDPLAFTRLAAREQVDALTAVVDLNIDLDANASQRQAAYTQRLDIGRSLKALGEILPPVAGVPDVEQSASELIGRITAAQAAEHDQANDVLTATRAANVVAQLEIDLAEAKATHMKAREIVESHVPFEDAATLTTELEAIEQTNAAVRENIERRRRATDAAALQESYDKRTAAIEAADEERAKALAAAKFPVPGLGFTDEGVTYKGVPFSQASSAEQIRVSLAMAMSLNPRLKVIRIMDGSLLDADSMALIAEMAGEHEYQLWIERVGDDNESAVVIEDGEVKA